MSVKANAPLGVPTTEYLGPGAIYFNYGEVDEAVVGATKKGGEFNDGVEFKQREADGDLGPVKGAIDLIKLAPVLKINALKIDKTNLQKFFAGMSLVDTDATYSKLTRMVDLSNSYITNVAYVGQNRSGQDIVIILYNVLGDGTLVIAFTKNEDIVPEVKFSGTFDPATFVRTDPDTYPYQVWLQKGAGYTVTFTVDDGVNPVVGALVTFNGATVETDVNGQAVFAAVPTGTNKGYKVEKTGFVTYQSAITVDGIEAVGVSLTAET